MQTITIFYLLQNNVVCFENLLLATFNETSVKEMKRHQRANFSVLSTFHAPNFSMRQDFLTNPIQEFKNL